MEKTVVFKDEFEKLGYSFNMVETDRGIEASLKPGNISITLQVEYGVLKGIIRQPTENVAEDIFDYFSTLFAETNASYDLIEIDEEKKTVIIPKKVMELIVEWIEEIAKYKGCGYVAIRGDKVESILNEKKYEKSKPRLYNSCDFILSTYQYEYYLKMMESKKGKLIQKMASIIEHFLKRLKEKDVTMLYLIPEKNNISFYIEGYEGIIQLYYQQTFYLKEKNIKQTFPFSTVEELEKALELLFTKVREKQRIKNVLKAPRYHFNHYLSIFNTEAKNEVYTFLESVMTPREIEEYCVKKRKEKKKISLENIEQFRVFKIDTYYFIIESGYGMEKLIVKTSIEEAEQYIFNEIVKQKKQSIKNTLSLL